ncbi:MAG TPA: hypothetical protein DCY88_07935 [Cyanobacteria bacterium UBA11372]|nr:hypothetical protein [Cyanobacteria bacterium UBA11372]
MWYSSVELVGLPGLPSSQRSIQRLAKREKWPSRLRQKRGGGWEYPLSCLPQETQAALLAACDTQSEAQERERGKVVKQLAIALLQGEATHYPLPITNYQGMVATAPEAISPATPAPIVTTTTLVTEKLQSKAEATKDAKLWILQEMRQYQTKRGISYSLACEEFAAIYNQKKVEIPSWILALHPTISRVNLLRWFKKLQEGRFEALSDARGKHRKGQTKIDTSPVVKDLVTSILLEFPHASIALIKQGLLARLEPELIPSETTIWRWVAAWKKQNPQLITALKSPDQFRSRYMASFGKYNEDIAYANQQWQQDSSPADILLVDGRYCLIFTIDVATRRGSILLSKTSKSTALAASLRTNILAWGVPESLKADNGKEYTSILIRRALSEIGTKHIFCQPFQPWQKGVVERFIRTFSHGLLELLPGFIGHNVTERKQIEARQSFEERFMGGKEIEIKITAQEFQQFCNRWCRIYNSTPHSELNGKTPLEVHQKLAAIKPILVLGEDKVRALDILLAEAPGKGIRRVQKQGIQVEGAFFIAPELEAYIGSDVQVRFDPFEYDMGHLFVFDRDGLFITIANCPERTGINRQKVAIEAKARQKERIKEEIRELKQIAKATKVEDLAQEILNYQEEKISNVAYFPVPTVEHDSEGLQAAQEAVTALDELQSAPKPDPLIADELKTSEEILSRFETRETRKQLSPDERFCALWEQIKAEANIALEDLNWMVVYSKTPSGKGVLLGLHDGEEALAYLRNVSLQNNTALAANQGR